MQWHFCCQFYFMTNSRLAKFIRSSRVFLSVYVCLCVSVFVCVCVCEKGACACIRARVCASMCVLVIVCIYVRVRAHPTLRLRPACLYVWPRVKYKLSAEKNAGCDHTPSRFRETVRKYRYQVCALTKYLHLLTRFYFYLITTWNRFCLRCMNPNIRQRQ